jgi:hypothetical protein
MKLTKNQSHGDVQNWNHREQNAENDFPAQRNASKPGLLELKAHLERFSWRAYMKSKYWDLSGNMAPGDDGAKSL